MAIISLVSLSLQNGLREFAFPVYRDTGLVPWTEAPRADPAPLPTLAEWLVAFERSSIRDDRGPWPEATSQAAQLILDHWGDRTGVPSTELLPLEDPGLLEGVNGLTYFLLLNRTNPDHSAVETLLPHLLKRLLGPRKVEVTVTGIDLGMDPTETAPPELLFSRVVDAVAGIELPHIEAKRIVVNGRAGQSTAKYALTYASAFLGYVVIDGQPPRRLNPTRALQPSPGWLAGAVAQARSLVQDYKGGVPADRVISRAADEGLLPWMVTEPSDRGDPEVRLSAFARLAYDLSLSAKPLFSTTAALLQQEGDRKRASRLRWLLDYWTGIRLWQNNLVPEMVLHNELHSQVVDRHLASVCRPLLRAKALTHEDVYLLGLAAWLHDWGHVPPTDSATREDVPVDPQDVRDLHGLMSRARLAPQYEQLHRLDEVEAKVIGMLAAHHQGWTSVDEHGGQRDGVHAALDAAAWLNEQSLAASARDAGVDLDRAQRLVALLRVADAADIGRHRVPHGDVTRFRRVVSDEIGLYLMRRWETVSVLEDVLGKYDDSVKAFREILRRLHQGGSDAVAADDQYWAELAAVADRISEQHVQDRAKRAIEYVRHCLKQSTYYDIHAAVRAVELEMVEIPGQEGWILRPRVEPTEGNEKTAGGRVLSDMRRELGPEPHKEPVRDALGRMRITVSETVAPQ